MNDLISRQAVVAKIREFADKISEEAMNRYDLFSEVSLLREAADHIESMQSVQQWTPVTEGLPGPQNDGDKDFSDWVLISLYLHKGNSVTTTAYYCFSEEKWYTNGRFVVGEIAAWMPLPEPYTTQSNDSKALDAFGNGEA